MANKSTSVARKFSVDKTKKGATKILYLIAGLFVGGLLEEYAMSKIAYLADTKTNESGETSKNTLGVILKSGIYILGGLLPAQLSNNEALEYAGYGLSSYGGLKLAKGISEKAKPYGLGSLSPYVNLPAPQYQGYLAPATEEVIPSR